MDGRSERVFFDFCETLIRFQTADRFVEYCRETLCRKRMMQLHRVTALAEKLRMFRVLDLLVNGWGSAVHKRCVLCQLKGIDDATLDRLGEAYFETVLQPAVIRPVVDIMKRHISQGDEVWIVSGGYDTYIKYFVHYYGLTGYVSTEIAFNANGICRGRMKGKDCMGRQKVSELHRCFGNDLSETVAYSDSCSDLPLLLAASSGIVISHGWHQAWVEQYNLQEVIWE